MSRSNMWQAARVKDQRRRRTESGGAAVEFALVLPLFMALVMGALDYGYFFFSQQVVTNAAREGARAATLVAPTNITQARADAKLASSLYMSGNGVGCPGGGDTCITVTSTTVNTVPAIEVLINYPTTSLTGFTSIILPSQVYARSTMLWQ